MLNYYLKYDLTYKKYKKEKRINSKVYLRAGLRTMLDVQSRAEVARYMRKLSLAIEQGRYDP